MCVDRSGDLRRRPEDPGRGNRGSLAVLLDGHRSREAQQLGRLGSELQEVQVVRLVYLPPARG
jgi:hypothetical protein